MSKQLVEITQKLMVKPNIKERERVAVVIRGVEKDEKKAPKKKVLEEGEEDEEGRGHIQRGGPSS